MDEDLPKIVENFHKAEPVEKEQPEEEPAKSYVTDEGIRFELIHGGRRFNKNLTVKRES